MDMNWREFLAGCGNCDEDNRTSHDSLVATWGTPLAAAGAGSDTAKSSPGSPPPDSTETDTTSAQNAASSLVTALVPQVTETLLQTTGVDPATKVGPINAAQALNLAGPLASYAASKLPTSLVGNLAKFA